MALRGATHHAPQSVSFPPVCLLRWRRGHPGFWGVTWGARRVGPWAADPAWGPTSAPRLPKAQPHKGALGGAVWGEGASGQPGPATGTGLSGWLERIIHTVWRRLFMHGGEA